MDFPVYDSDNMVPKDPARRPALEKKIKHYSNFHKILLVGEGDFSFSLALANAFGSAENMVPTSLDSRDKVLSSYDNGQENLQHLENLGAMTSHDVDATKMCKHEILRDRLFDRIVFNFPRAGFYKKEKDAAVIKKHRHLVKMFFKNAKTMLSKTGEIHVTHQVKDPYNQWKVVDEAAKCGLVLKESIEFNKADYPGYTNRRGAEPIIGGTFFLGECRTYTFILRESMTGPIMLPKISEEALPEIPQAMWELEPDRKNREAAHMESLINHLKTVADKAIKERDEFERQRNEAIHQRDEARREKEIITIQLAEAMRLKEDAVEQRAVSILELTFEREARKAAETAKENMEDLLNHFRRLVYNLHGDHALCQMEEAYREKEKIAKQLDEALKLKEEVTKEREKIKREQTDLANQKDEVYREKEKSSKWLDEVLILKEETIKEREKILREQTDLFNQKDEALWSKEKISEQLDGAVTLKQEVLKEMERILRKQTDLSDQKDEVFWEKEQIAEQVDEAVTLKQEVPKEMERIPSKQNDCNNPKNEVYGMKEKIAKWLDVALRLKDEVIKKMKGFSRLAVALKLLNVITNLVESIRLKEGKGFDWRELLRIVTPLLFGGLKW